jgi:hypothetical protein
MLEEMEDELLLEEIRTEKKSDFKQAINKKKLNKWELDEAFLGEI